MGILLLISSVISFSSIPPGENHILVVRSFGVLRGLSRKRGHLSDLSGDHSTKDSCHSGVDLKEI